uniref:hypothetical protein n=1 Tax=Mycobacterium marinum TaxID=1781 RepID=UPI00356682E8
MLDPPDEPTQGRPDGALGAVADAIAGADQETDDDWQIETDLWAATELAAADNDYASGITISGGQLRHRYSLP